MKTKTGVIVAWGIPLRRGSLTLLVLIGIAAAQVYAAQSEGNGQDTAPRTLEVLDVGYRLPIEIVAVRNLQKREHWVRDLELEVKNVSTKPIYEIYFTLFLPDDKNNNGASYGVNLQYGRIDLIHPRQRPSTEDKPLGPGKTVLLKVSEGLWGGYEYHLRNENVPEKASYRVRLTILAINFGDGTGFINGGVPYPREPWMESRPQRYVRIPLESR
ncbi:MAG: hypothetical protein WAV47_09325 [Blastocatellia bacterium]